MLRTACCTHLGRTGRGAARRHRGERHKREQQQSNLNGHCASLSSTAANHLTVPPRLQAGTVVFVCRCVLHAQAPNSKNTTEGCAAASEYTPSTAPRGRPHLHAGQVSRREAASDVGLRAAATTPQPVAQPSRASAARLPDNLRERLERGRGLGQVPLEPPHRRLLVLRRPALGVEVDELQRVLERQVRELARCIFGHP